jgi:hypothetical protein
MNVNSYDPLDLSLRAASQSSWAPAREYRSFRRWARCRNPLAHEDDHLLGQSHGLTQCEFRDPSRARPSCGASKLCPISWAQRCLHYLAQGVADHDVRLLDPCGAP